MLYCSSIDGNAHPITHHLGQETQGIGFGLRESHVFMNLYRNVLRRSIIQEDDGNEV
jgi:hypothetical protein